jgi:hypothetical protein
MTKVDPLQDTHQDIQAKVNHSKQDWREQRTPTYDCRLAYTRSMHPSIHPLSPHCEPRNVFCSTRSKCCVESQRESEELRAALKQKDERRGAAMRQSSPPAWDGGSGPEKWRNVGGGGGRQDADQHQQPLYGIEPEPLRYNAPQYALSGSVMFHSHCFSPADSKIIA